MPRYIHVHGWMAILIFFAAGTVVAQTVVIRDARYGHGLDATIELAPLNADAAPTVATLSAALEQAQQDGSPRRQHGTRLRLVLDGRTAARIHHDGHRPLLTVIEPAADIVSWTLWLQPETDPEADADEATDLIGVVHGHVIDPTSLRPMQGVRLSLAGGPALSISDAAGAFHLPFPPGHHATAIRREQLIATAPDGRRLERAVALTDGADLRLILDFVGGGSDDPGHRHLQAADTSWQTAEPGRGGHDITGAGIQPPASVRVGFADASCTATCCTGSCTHVCVYDLETYVRRGLNDEWIASWNTQSLRAGSVAYRSYGAWHALNPVPGRAFDICSSACCQVNDGDTSANTDLAVARTTGLMLERGGGVFRSEYSAENNCLLGSMSCANVDLSCGNGHAGSPSANWPCLADPVGLDRDCFGHGRGMSQWGTQRWSLAPHQQTWRWQVNHYYNHHGAGSGLRTSTLTSALVLDDLRPRKRTVVPGESVVIDYLARNLAATTHHHVLLGASLRLQPGPYVDDPANDAPTNLPAGASDRQRVFQLPGTLSVGRYDLYGSLYLDIDENATISAIDLAQDLLHKPAAVRVVSASDRIFYDGMQ